MFSIFSHFYKSMSFRSVDFVFSSAPGETSVLLSGSTQVSTPENGCLRLPECGQPTRYNMPFRLGHLIDLKIDLN